jgi:hypothetical protein
VRNKRGLSSSKGTKAFVQTFTETYPKLFTVQYIQKEEETPKQLMLQPMDLLHLKKSRLLSGIPALIQSSTDRRALLPIFVDSGIENWLNYPILPISPLSYNRKKFYTKILHQIGKGQSYSLWGRYKSIT